MFQPVWSNLDCKWGALLLDDTLFWNWGSKPSFLYCCHYKIEEVFCNWALSFWKMFYFEKFQTSTKRGKKTCNTQPVAITQIQQLSRFSRVCFIYTFFLFVKAFWIKCRHRFDKLCAVSMHSRNVDIFVSAHSPVSIPNEIVHNSLVSPNTQCTFRLLWLSFF